MAHAIHLKPPKSRVVDLKPDDRLIVVVSRAQPALAAGQHGTQAGGV